MPENRRGKNRITQKRKKTINNGGPTILITGANRGVGLALTKQCLARGARVAAGARDPASPPLRELSRHYSKETFLPVALDVSDPDSLQKSFKEVRAFTDRLDVLVNNAGVFPEPSDEPFERIDPEWMRLALEVNVTGVLRVTQVFLPWLKKSENPRVVNMSSGAASITVKQDGRRYCYGTSKAALNMFTRTLAFELKPQGIIVVAMSPGWVRTDMGGANADLSPEESARAMAGTIDHLSLDQAGLFLDRNGDATRYAW